MNAPTVRPGSSNVVIRPGARFDRGGNPIIAVRNRVSRSDEFVLAVEHPDLGGHPDIMSRSICVSEGASFDRTRSRLRRPVRLLLDHSFQKSRYGLHVSRDVVAVRERTSQRLALDDPDGLHRLRRRELRRAVKSGLPRIPARSARRTRRCKSAPRPDFER